MTGRIKVLLEVETLGYTSNTVLDGIPDVSHRYNAGFKQLLSHLNLKFNLKPQNSTNMRSRM